MLEIVTGITVSIVITAAVGWIAYLVGHMHGGAEARARWAREEVQ